MGRRMGEGFLLGASHHSPLRGLLVAAVKRRERSVVSHNTPPVSAVERSEECRRPARIENLRRPFGISQYAVPHACSSGGNGFTCTMDLGLARRHYR